MKYIDYQPRGAALEIFSRRDPEVMLSGPAGTGKTRAGLEKLHAIAEKHAGCRLLLLRKTRASLTDTGIVTYEELVLPDKSVKVTYQGAEYPNGSYIKFGGMDKWSKIMSGEYDIAYVVEATELMEDDWEAITTRLRWGRVPYQQILGDCNPGPPKHWLKRRAEAGRLIMLESRHEDNPVLYDGNSYTDRGKSYLAKLDALSGVRYLRLRKGVWAAAEGMVYDMWDPAIHMIDQREIPFDWPRALVVDFGFTNPFVCQWWARDPDGRLIRYREIYRTQRLVEDHARHIRELCAKEPTPHAIICDHDAEDRATLERHLGFATTAAFKDISPGIQAVQRRLRIARDGKPRIYFMRDALVERDQELLDAKKPCCTEEEIESYVWPRNVTEKSSDLPPVKKDDHGMDAMRYMVAAVDAVAEDPSEQHVRMTYYRPYTISPY